MPSSQFEPLSSEPDVPGEPSAAGDPIVPVEIETQRDLRRIERNAPQDTGDVEILLDEPAPPLDVRPRNADEDWSLKFRTRMAEERRERGKVERQYETLAQETERLRKENLELRGKAQGAEIGGELVILNQQLKAARADADTDKETEIMAKIAENGARRVIQPTAPAPAPAPVRQNNAEPNEHLEKWLTDNPWFNTQQHAAESAAAVAINHQMYNVEGYDDRDPSYYRELNRRIKEKVRVPNQEQRPPRSPVVGGEMGAPAGTRNSASRGIVITPEDKAIMRKFKQDPSDPKVIENYARTKRDLRMG